MLKYREIVTVISLKSKKKKLALTLFYYVSRKIWLGIQISLFAETIIVFNMKKFLVILFIMKLIAQINIFKFPSMVLI